MKILCCGDTHITNKKPKNRLDDYYKTLLGKLKQELEIAKEEDCLAVILPGDVFDTFRENHAVVQDIIYLFKSYRMDIYAVAGQHDQQFHNNDLKGTALETLVAAGVVTMLSDTPITYGPDAIAIYGSSWKAEVPEITTPNSLNILVLHKMIVDEKLWAQQEGHTWANHILMKNGFDLIVSGDNHNQFTVSKGLKNLINMGSMMRSTIAQVNHRPAVCVYDTISKTIELIELDVKPFDEVMCLDKAQKEKEKNEQLDAFVSSLKDTDVTEQGVGVKLDFIEALNLYINTNKIEDEVSDLIYECLENA